MRIACPKTISMVLVRPNVLSDVSLTKLPKDSKLRQEVRNATIYKCEFEIVKSVKTMIHIHVCHMTYH
jgi:hypothetical protein